MPPHTCSSTAVAHAAITRIRPLSLHTASREASKAQADPLADMKAAFVAVATEGGSHGSSAAAARKGQDGVASSPRAHALDADAGGGQAAGKLGINAPPPHGALQLQSGTRLLRSRASAAAAIATTPSGDAGLRSRASRHPLRPHQAPLTPRRDEAAEAETRVARTCAQSKRRRKD